MKLQRVLGLSAAIVLAQLAQADPSALSAPALGIAEATLNFCAQIDPKSAARYQEQVKLLVQGTSEDAVSDARTSDDYRQAYDSTADMIGKVSERDALQ